MSLSSKIKTDEEVGAVALTSSLSAKARWTFSRIQRSSLLWILVSLVGLLYLITSLRVVLSAFFWLPIMPEVYYQLESALYWPLGLYFDGAYALLGRAIASYQVYVLVVRGPFIIVPLVLWILAVRRLRKKS
jgi:hypothetical protein